MLITHQFVQLTLQLKRACQQVIKSSSDVRASGLRDSCRVFTGYPLQICKNRSSHVLIRHQGLAMLAFRWMNMAGVMLAAVMLHALLRSMLARIMLHALLLAATAIRLIIMLNDRRGIRYRLVIS